MTNRSKGNVALLITAIIWGSGFIAQKLGMAYIGPLAFNSIRQLLAAFILIPYSLREVRKAGVFDRTQHRREVIQRRKKDLLKGAGFCGILLALGTNLQQYGLVDSSAGKVGFITAIYIVLVPILGVMMGRRSSFRIWACAFVALIGFALLSLRGGLGGATRGDWMALLSTVFFACQIVAVNHFVTRRSAILFSNVQMFVSAILGLIGMAVLEDPTMPMLAMSWKPILYSALFPTAIGYTLQVVGQKYTDPTVASMIMSLEAVFAAILGSIFLHEHMEAMEWMGCLIIFAATLIAQLPDGVDSADSE